MRVFVDSGIYMDYLKGDGVSLHMLETFELFLEEEKFKLLFPEITKEEIFRGIPADHRRFSENDKLKVEKPLVPVGVNEGEKYKQADELLHNFNKVIEEVRKEALEAVDGILKNHIEKLIKKSEDIHEDESILNKAHLRKLKANPPGKPNDPLGDEIVWELFLEKCFEEDLVIITHDGDWRGLDTKKFTLHPFLLKEWESKSKMKIILYPSLSPFIQSIDPKKVTKEDTEAEKRRVSSPTLTINVGDSIRIGSNVSIYPGTVQNLGIMSPSASFSATGPSGPPSASPSASPSISEWQPVTVVGTVQPVQCFSCGRWFSPEDYYGFTPQGYKCKYCSQKT